MTRTDRIELAARRALDDRPAALAALAWYDDAREWIGDLAARNGLPVETIAGIVAALSPQQSWREQQTYTQKVLDALAAGQRTDLPGPGYNRNKAKAAAIYDGADPFLLTGDKVSAFFRCLIGQTDRVCVDRWAFRIAYGADEPRWITAKRYRETAAAFVGAAARLAASYPALADVLTPVGVQALTWVWWRDNPTDRF